MQGYFQGQEVEMIQAFGTRWIPFAEELSGEGDNYKGYGLHGLPWVYDSETETYQETKETIEELLEPKKPVKDDEKDKEEVVEDTEEIIEEEQEVEDEVKEKKGKLYDSNGKESKHSFRIIHCKLKEVLWDKKKETSLRRKMKSKKNAGKTKEEVKEEMLNEELIFITNIDEELLSSEEISLIYKKRWDIEVLFKFLKQELHFSHLINNSLKGFYIKYGKQ